MIQCILEGLLFLIINCHDDTKSQVVHQYGDDLISYINHSEYSEIFQNNTISDIGNIQHLMGSISIQSSNNGNHSVDANDVENMISNSSRKHLTKYISDILVEN